MKKVKPHVSKAPKRVKKGGGAAGAGNAKLNSKMKTEAGNKLKVSQLSSIQTITNQCLTVMLAIILIQQALLNAMVERRRQEEEEAVQLAEKAILKRKKFKEVPIILIHRSQAS